MKNIRVLVLGLVLVLVSAFFINRAYKGQSELAGRKNVTSLEQKLRMIFVRCNTGKTRTLSSQNFNCLGRGFAPLIQKDNLVQMMDALVSLYSKEPGTDVLGIAQCHLPAHIVGSEAVKKGLTFNEVFHGCSTKCSYGCVHGAYSENFSRDPQFLADFTNTCSKYLVNPSIEDMHSCWHITGHWLGELLRSDPDKAVADCLKFPAENGGQDYCISGLRMELLVGSPPKNLSTTILTQMSTTDFCNKFPVKYRGECYSESGFYVYRAFGDVTRTVENCKTIPAGYQKACATSAGVAYYFSAKDKADKVVNFCKSFGENEKNCVFGALEISISEANFYHTAVDICNLEKDKFGKECFAQIGSKSLELNGKAFKDKICATLTGTERNYCEATGGTN